MYDKAVDLDCDKCVISFKDVRTSGFGKEINITFNELYSDYENGTCDIFWDTEQGYMKNG